MEQKTSNTALLVMDMQAKFVSALPPESQLVTKSVAQAMSTARKHNIPVIYVVLGFRNGMPEVSENSSKVFAHNKSYFSTLNMEEFMKLHDDLLPTSSEITVVKRRVSAFTGSDLEVVLRAFGIGHLVLTGIATHGVVLSTLLEAADKDYELTVLSDCCADSDAELHHMLTTKVFPRHANVFTVSEWLK